MVIGVPTQTRPVGLTVNPGADVPGAGHCAQEDDVVNPMNRQTRPAYRHNSPLLLYASVRHPCKIRTESKIFVPEIYGILSVKTLAPTFSRPAKRIFLKNSFQSKQRFFTRF
jgi:hypothetical protein